MLVNKPVDMGQTNLSRRHSPAREPSPEVRHDMAIQANRAEGVSPTAPIAGEGVGNYVNLATGTRFTSTGITTWLMVHSET
jgi:hypothetical protein